MKPADAARGCVDGGWWPWSTDPTTEFPPLITATAVLGTPVVRVSYNVDTWDAGRRWFTVRGSAVRVEGFGATQPHTVTLFGPGRTRTRLLVIPPATPGGAARAALRAAADPGSTATAEEILEWNGIGVRHADTTAPPGWRAFGPEPVGRRRADRDARELRAATHGARRDLRLATEEIAS